MLSLGRLEAANQAFFKVWLYRLRVRYYFIVTFVGLIGEMRKVRGEVRIGGSLAYCAQTPWIQNASLVGLL